MFTEVLPSASGNLDIFQYNTSRPLLSSHQFTEGDQTHTSYNYAIYSHDGQFIFTSRNYLTKSYKVEMWKVNSFTDQHGTKQFMPPKLISVVCQGSEKKMINRGQMAPPKLSF